MSEEVIDETKIGVPPLAITVQGTEFLSPTAIEKDVRNKHYYVTSPVLPLGNFGKAHELFVIGGTMLVSVIERVFSDNYEKKIKAMEIASLVVGQASRARGGSTQQTLTRATTEIIQRGPERRGFLARLLGR